MFLVTVTQPQLTACWSEPHDFLQTRPGSGCRSLGKRVFLIGTEGKLLLGVKVETIQLEVAFNPVVYQPGRI